MQFSKKNIIEWVGAILVALGLAFACTYEPAPGYDVIWWMYVVAILFVFVGALMLKYAYNSKEFVRSAFAVLATIPNIYFIRKYDRAMYYALKRSGLRTVLTCAYDEGLYYYDCTHK